jgi:hypothetical protein
MSFFFTELNMPDLRHAQQPGGQSDTLLTLHEFLSLDPILENAKIRTDKATRQASVIDVIRLITGRSSKRASEAIMNLSDMFSKSIVRIRINGQGRLTPVCDAQTMGEIISELPGKAAKKHQRKQRTRHARSERFCHNLMTSGTASRVENRTLLQANIATTKPTPEEMKDFFQVDIPRPEEASHDGFVYFVRVRDSLDVKIGYSKDPVKRLQQLQTGCPTELDLEQVFFTTTAFASEQYLHQELNDHHVRGEWFKLTQEQVMSAFLKQCASLNP